MTNRHIVDRALPDRAKLIFYFPVPTQGESYYVVELPFFENVSIKEAKKAKYQKYSLISRSSNLYSYLGADSRNLNLSFNMTLPHILEEHPEITIDKYINYQSDKDNLEAEKQNFIKPYKVDSAPKGMAFVLGTEYTKSLAKDSARQVLGSEWLKQGTSFQDLFELSKTYGLDNFSIDQEQSPFLPLITKDDEVPSIGAEVNNIKNRVIDLIIYWTNIVRSSVVNYAKNPIYGPPVIRLRHGIMYQDVPCICTDYSINYNEAAGYDLKTLLPNQLQINMKLEEIRTGDFGEFNPNDSNNPIKRDNLAGWESVVLGETHSMDPGYGGKL